MSEILTEYEEHLPFLIKDKTLLFKKDVKALLSKYALNKDVEEVLITTDAKAFDLEDVNLLTVENFEWEEVRGLHTREIRLYDSVINYKEVKAVIIEWNYIVNRSNEVNTTFINSKVVENITRYL